MKTNVERLYYDLEAQEGGVSGIVMPYGEMAPRMGYQLQVESGSLSGRMSDVIMNIQHDGSQLLGRTGPKGNLTLTDSPAQLMASMTYPETMLGRDAKHLVDIGVLTGFSAELQVLSDEWVGGIRRVTKGALFGIGLVARPAMAGATLFSGDANALVMDIAESGEWVVSPERLTRRSFSGEMLWDEITVASVARRQAVLFRPGSLDVSQPVTLLLGSDYNTSAANTELDGSLSVKATNRGVEWRVGNLPKTENGGKILGMLAAGLVTGWRVGYAATRVKERRAEVMGFEMTLTEVEAATLCEVRLTSDGTGGAGPVQAARRRRRRR